MEWLAQIIQGQATLVYLICLLPRFAHFIGDPGSQQSSIVLIGIGVQHFILIGGMGGGGAPLRRGDHSPPYRKFKNETLVSTVLTLGLASSGLALV